ncbi:MAG TPA: hypothetical protein DCL76_05570 [Chloroflexi bacterium]|nr:hypothetical protein [Chloroflexota bacterium]|tara:strand:+ start:1520 stop:2533 length:1014 start_codon:yes stop_codon:yes gene_type:complete
MNNTDSQIKLWRSTVVDTLTNSTESSVSSISSNIVFSGARQCISQALREFDMNRTDYVGIPDYSSHCVLDFVGRIATPVPLRLLPKDRASAILLYDQWGWEKSVSARFEITNEYEDVNIIWDRVDSLPISYQLIAENDQHQADAQIFSLKKTLNGFGGGLLWMRDNEDFHKTTSNDKALVIELFDIVRRLNDQELIKRKINRFICGECDINLDLVDWLDKCDLDHLSLQEHSARRARIDICVNNLGQEKLPEWMQHQIENYDMPAPGIWPLVVNIDSNDLIYEISKLFNFETRFYHFNFNNSYLYPKWTKVLALPLHSELSKEVLSEFFFFIRDFLY